MPVREVTVVELQSCAPSAVLFDVREPDEYAAGHVPGAINVPLSSVPENVSRMALGGDVYVICQAGGRSMQACQFLADQDEAAGTTFINVAGGTGGWILGGNEVVLGDRPR